jgi:hypothetical protein
MVQSLEKGELEILSDKRFKHHNYAFRRNLSKKRNFSLEYGFVPY